MGRKQPGLPQHAELYALALRDPANYPGVLESPIEYWNKLTKRTAGDSNWQQAKATLLLAATRGLLLDLCATGDRKRVTSALQLLQACVKTAGDYLPPGKFQRRPMR